MERDSIPARAKQIENIDEDIPSITLVKDPDVKKTIPLASLSPIASKTPTPDRVNALKDALVKAMAGSSAANAKQAETPVAQPSATPDVQIKVKEPQTLKAVVQVPQSFQIPMQPVTAPQQIQQPNVAGSGQPQPREVPEDVLKNVLKM